MLRAAVFETLPGHVKQPESNIPDPEWIQVAELPVKIQLIPMKMSSWPSLGLAALLTAGFCPRADAGVFSNNFEMLVVAERAKDAPPAQAGTVSYSAIDGGYIEAGDPMAGDNAPTADRVRQVLYDSLKDQGFAASRTSPSVLLTYFWGVIRLDREQVKKIYGVKANQDARIKLVSTEQLGAEVENHILGRQRADGTNMDASSPTLLMGPTETVVQNASRPRIFVIVTAYDYQALTQHHEPTPLWRVKLSAQETSGDMDQVIPSLIAKGAPFFGKDLPEARIVTAPLSSSSGPAATPASSLQPAPESNLDGQLIANILGRQRVEFSGTNP